MNEPHHNIRINQLEIADAIFEKFNEWQISYCHNDDQIVFNRETLSGEYIGLEVTDLRPWPHYTTATLEFESEGYTSTIWAVLRHETDARNAPPRVIQFAVWSDDADEMFVYPPLTESPVNTKE